MPDIRDLALASELRNRGIMPSRRLGQNFMVDRQLLDYIVRVAGVTSADVVLEVGTGAGFLTQRLCQSAARVVSVEIDAGLCGLSAERLEGVPNLALLNCDALAGEHHWSDPVNQAVAEALSKAEAARLKLVANLPYSIVTSVVQAILFDKLPFEGAWFTCQKEVAQRLCAPPGHREYGFVSALVALMADIRIVRKLPASVFWPRPRIESAVIELVVSAQKRSKIPDIERMKTGMSKLFGHKRRQLSAALKRLEVDRPTILRIEEELAESGIPRGARVFHLPPETLVGIAGQLW